MRFEFFSLLGKNAKKRVKTCLHGILSKISLYHIFILFEYVFNLKEITIEINQYNS